MYKEGNGLKYKNRKRTDSGYIKVDLKAWENASLPKDRFAHVQGALVQKVKLMLADAPAIPSDAPASTVIEAPAEQIHRHVDANSVALTIFSPPYCNCFNYFKMYKVELWMGGFVSTYAELRQLNRRGLRSHVETILKRPGDVPQEEVEPFAKLLDETKLWDKRISAAVRGYFIDMATVLQGLYSVSKPSAKCVLVVGNSAYGGVVIPTDVLLAEIAKRVGFKVEKLAVARHLTTSSQQRVHLGDRIAYLRESILVLSKGDPRLEDLPLEPVSEIPLADSERNGKVFLIGNAGITSGTHKFHRYPGKFIPHVPRWALRRYTRPGDTVVDPFCGSGTTLVEAMQHGVHSVGIDVDPIAKLISRVKTTPIQAVGIEAVKLAITSRIKRRRAPRFRPGISTLSHWFSEDAIRELGIIRDEIEHYRGSTAIYDFLIVCFASIVRRASNADNQTQKTYVSHTQPKTPEPAIALFLSTLEDYTARIAAIAASPSECRARVLEAATATQFASQLATLGIGSVDAVITSPPYLNSVDYVYNQMAEHFWIGDLFSMQTQDLQNRHKRRYIGTSRVESKEYSQIVLTGNAEVDAVAAKVRSKSAKNAYIISKYFSDMRAHFFEAARLLKKGGKYVCVIGDSVVSGEPIMVSDLIGRCAAEAGLHETGRFGYEIRNRHMRFPRMGRGGIVRYDWVLELSHA